MKISIMNISDFMDILKIYSISINILIQNMSEVKINENIEKNSKK